VARHGPRVLGGMRDRLVELRRQGLTFPQIAERLGGHVEASSIRYQVKKAGASTTKLTSEQKAKPVSEWVIPPDMLTTAVEHVRLAGSLTYDELAGRLLRCRSYAREAARRAELMGAVRRQEGSVVYVGAQAPEVTPLERYVARAPRTGLDLAARLNTRTVDQARELARPFVEAGRLSYDSKNDIYSAPMREA